MLKRVLSVALFLTMVFSLIPMASAANDIAKIEFIAVANSEVARADLASITAPGGQIGILIPGTNNNKLTITGLNQDIKRNSFDVVIVFDGTVEKDKGFITVNNKPIAYKDIIQYADGTSAVVVPFTLLDDLPHVRYPFSDWGSSQGYRVVICQTGKPDIDYNFTVEYINDSFTPYPLIGSVAYDYSNYVGGFYIAIDPGNVAGVVSSDADAVYGVVTASILNFRSGPSTSKSIIGQLPFGSVVEILDAADGWYKVNVAGVTGYVFAAYVA